MLLGPVKEEEGGRGEAGEAGGDSDDWEVARGGDSREGREEELAIAEADSGLSSFSCSSLLSLSFLQSENSISNPTGKRIVHCRAKDMDENELVAPPLPPLASMDRGDGEREYRGDVAPPAVNVCSPAPG